MYDPNTGNLNNATHPGAIIDPGKEPYRLIGIYMMDFFRLGRTLMLDIILIFQRAVRCDYTLPVKI